MNATCGICGIEIESESQADTVQHLVDHWREEHAIELARLEADAGPLEGQMRGAPVIDTTTDWRDEMRGQR